MFPPILPPRNSGYWALGAIRWIFGPASQQSPTVPVKPIQTSIICPAILGHSKGRLSQEDLGQKSTQESLNFPGEVVQTGHFEVDQECAA